MKIICGPLIGKVTSTSARIVVECDFDGDLTCILRDASGGGQQMSKDVKCKKPTAFQFQNLSIGTFFTVTFPNVVFDPPISSVSFTTLPEPWDFRGRPGRIAVVSCDKYIVTRDEIKPKQDLWAHLARQIEKKNVDYCVHIGDNVYADSDLYLVEKGKKASTPQAMQDCAFLSARTVIENLPIQEWPSRFPQLVEIFRQEYRRTFNHPPKKFVLANLPNLMIIDDHDMRDDWGDRPQDTDVRSPDFFAALAGFEAYNEYQRNLYEDFEASDSHMGSLSVRRTFHFHNIGDLSLLFLDLRCGKTFHRIADDPHPQLGSEQFNALISALSPGGFCSNSKCVLVLSPVPFLYLGNRNSKIGAKYVDDLEGAWEMDYNLPDCLAIIRKAFEWRTPEKELVLVGGDVHQGGYTKISLEGCPRHMLQFTASAIANRIANWYENRAIELIRGFHDQVSDDIKFQHIEWVKYRNYGILCLSNGQEGVEATAQLVVAKDRRGLTLKRPKIKERHCLSSRGLNIC